MDWCPWCQKLEEEIFSQKEFLAYAMNHFVLFQADYPRYKEQPIKIKEQNEALAKTYSINRYPIVLILDEKGKTIAETGYLRGGVGAYLDHLEKLLKK
jgi:thioredoxin-related protein